MRWEASGDSSGRPLRLFPSCLHRRVRCCHRRFVVEGPRTALASPVDARGVGVRWRRPTRIRDPTEAFMSALRQSLSGALAESILVVPRACRDATEPAAIALPESPSLARGKAPAPTGPLNLRSTGNTSWSVSLAWDPRTGGDSFTGREHL